MNIKNNLDIAKAEVNDLLKENSEYGLWKSIRVQSQLEFINNDFDYHGVFQNSSGIIKNFYRPGWMV